MKNVFKEFKNLLEENNDFPKDELRDYYLVNAKQLLKNNPELSKVIFEQKTCLMLVIEQIVKGGHSIRISHLGDIAWDLIELATPEILNNQDKEKNSVIHLACGKECFSVGILDFMKEQGADFSLVNAKGETPLMLVANFESLDDVKFIHAYTDKELINQQDFIKGRTALHRAVKYKRINTVHYLLQEGANPHIKDFEGYRPMDYIEYTLKDNSKRNHTALEIKKILMQFENGK